MTILYFDCSCGAAGDMILAALIDAGVPLEEIRQTVDRLNLPGVELQAVAIRSCGITATRAVVTVSKEQHTHRHLRDIVSIIEKARLDPYIHKTSIAVFRRLAEAESRVHGIPIEDVHFHEIGAVDTIVDIVGSVAAIARIAPNRIVCSALNTGGGSVRCAHGWLPVPAPATAELIRGFPVYGSDISFELLTPTGAALLTTLADDFGPLPQMTVERIGSGAGTHDIGRPNLLRVFVGKSSRVHAGTHPALVGLDTDRVAVIDTQIDDMTPECLAAAMEHLLAAGAIDTVVIPIHMKKGRPAFWLQVLAHPTDLERIAGMLLEQTTTFGIRWRMENRIKLPREIRSIETRFGAIRMKIGWMNGKTVQAAPEYEDCRLAAQRYGVSVRSVMAEACATFHLTSEPHDVERADHPT
ncbi:MAG: nickel pincer cofactor biosynthesis protein LarC [Thermodesulfobacteriota bacterium]